MELGRVIGLNVFFDEAVEKFSQAVSGASGSSQAEGPSEAACWLGAAQSTLLKATVEQKEGNKSSRTETIKAAERLFAEHVVGALSFSQPFAQLICT